MLEAQKALLENDFDPTHRISALPSARNKPITVTKDATLKEAVTLMMLHEFSQLPITSDGRNVKGVISWTSIGQGFSQNCSGEYVRDFMESVPEIVEYDTPLFDAVKKIISNGYILVRDHQKKISGIVTTTDISAQFLILTEPFLILEEVENHLRNLIEDKLSLEEVLNVVSKNETHNIIDCISDLSFGGYIRVLENSDNWEKLHISIDRKIFIRKLHEVRKIRNNIMHFRSEGISTEELAILRQISKFFLNLNEIIA